MPPLTQKQAQVLDVFRSFVNVNGYTPSIRELAAVLDLSNSGVHRHLVLIKNKGYLYYSRPSRKFMLAEVDVDTRVYGVLKEILDASSNGGDAVEIIQLQLEALEDKINHKRKAGV